MTTRFLARFRGLSPTRAVSDCLLLLLLAAWAPLRAQTFSIQTYAGTLLSLLNGDGGPPTKAFIDHPAAVTLDAAGNLYIADRGHNQIRRVSADGKIITNIAGSGTAGYSGDNGPATLAALRAPEGVVVDSSGNVYIADTGNHAIRRIAADTHVITTIAGTGAAGLGANNVAAKLSALNSPVGVAIKFTELWIADTGNNQVRYVDLTTGIIRTPANMFQSTNCLTARLCAPRSLVWARNEMWVADTDHCRVGVIDPLGFTPRFGQTSTPCQGEGGDGTEARVARLDHPSALAITERGDFYIAESGGSRIRWKPYNSPLIETVAGTGVRGFTGDGGLAVNANLAGPLGIAVDTLGRIFIADTDNYRVRLLDGCVAISPASATATSYTTIGKIPLTGPKGCKWLVEQQTDWLGYYTVGAGDGDGVADYRVLENSGPARTGTLKIGQRIFTVDQDAFTLPTVAADGVRNFGDLSANVLSPGGRILLQGSGLAAAPLTASTSPLPFRLADTAIAVNGLSARMLSISPTQIDMEVPWMVQADEVELAFFVNGRTSRVKVPGGVVGPTLFNAGNGLARARKVSLDGTDNGPVSLSNRLSPGDSVLLYTSGVGIVDKPPADGALANGPTESYRTVTVQIGGIEAPIVTDSLFYSGDISGAGVSFVIAQVPTEVPAGDAVPVIVRVASQQSTPLGLPIGGVQNLDVALELVPPPVDSAVPATWLTMRVNGLHPAAPVAVRFFNDAGFSSPVNAVEVTEDWLSTVVPLFYDEAKQDYAAGVVSIEVIQVINGRTIRSNRIDGFQIEDLPAIDLQPGLLTSAVFRALGQSSTDVKGGLSSIDAVSASKLGTSRVRGLFDNLQQQSAVMKDAVDQVVNDPNLSLPVGQLQGEPIALDSSVLASTDRVLAALILAHPPYDPPSQRSGIPSRPDRIRAKKDPVVGSADDTPLPDCEIPDPPVGRQLEDLLTGRRPAISYARDYQACLDQLARLQLVVDLSYGLKRWSGNVDRKLKQAFAYLGFAAPIAIAESPRAAKSVFIKQISQIVSIPVYLNLVGQTMFRLYALVDKWATGSDAAKAAADITRRNLADQVWSEAWDVVREIAVAKSFVALDFNQAEPLGSAFGKWANATKDAMKEAPESTSKASEPTVQFDGKGGNMTVPNEGVDTVEISGTVSDPATGAPQQDSEITACPSLPGQPPRAAASTYDDGSYTVIVPVNFTQDDSKLCKLVIHPRKSDATDQDQTGVVDLNNEPKVINFPDDSPVGDVDLRGEDRGSGITSGCGKIEGIGLFNLDIKLHNLSWAKLLRDGGTVSGDASYRAVAASCTSGTVNYVESIAFGDKASATIAAGGKGQVSIGAASVYDVTLTAAGLEGDMIPALVPLHCPAATSCSFHLVLNVVR